MMSTTPISKSAVDSPEARARAFMAIAHHFQLGHLPTESRHPRTTKLSELAHHRLPEAVNLLKEVELEALKSVPAQMDKIEVMRAHISDTLRSGGRVFFCGCGATGRLSLSLETLWREEMNRIGRQDLVDRTVSFIAGGDYALVRSIENFEDYPEYGARQLHDLGFSQNDLMIGTSEGGETPFVIGAVEEAAKISSRQPYFLFCNPADMLAKTVERSRMIIENPSIITFALETGPMALAGSTRLQATTTLMLAVGAALFTANDDKHHPSEIVENFTDALKSADFSQLAPLIQEEAGIYERGEYCLHRTERYGMTVVTDTTERSPTFSLLPFENSLDPLAPTSWTYLVIGHAQSTQDAWEKILGRSPRALDWPAFRERFGQDSLKGFDFSPASIERRSQRLGQGRLHIFDINSDKTSIILELNGLRASLKKPGFVLTDNLLLKAALNISSTLTMGRLGRFNSNLMLYVRAANNKLVDRAIRYVRQLLEDEGLTSHSYADVCLALFTVTDGLRHDEPAVLRTFEYLRDRMTGESRTRRSPVDS